MNSKLIQDKLVLCLESIISNILQGFSGYIEINKNGFLHELENDDFFKDHFNNNEISSLIKSQYIEIFDMVFCELYFENERLSYENGAEKGSVIFPLSDVIKFSTLYDLNNNQALKLEEIEKLRNHIVTISEIISKKLVCIYISDRMENGEVEYVSYEINI